MRAAAARIEGATFESILTRAVFESPLPSPSNLSGFSNFILDAISVPGTRAGAGGGGGC